MEEEAKHLDILRSLVQQHREALHDIDTRVYSTASKIRERMASIREHVNNTPLKKLSVHYKGYRRMITENMLLSVKLYIYQAPQFVTRNHREAVKTLKRALRLLDVDAPSLTTSKDDEKKRRRQGILLLMIFYDCYTTDQLGDIVDKYNKLLSL